MVAAAMIGTAVVGAGASIYSGNRAASAAREGAEQSNDTQLAMYAQNRADMAPYRQVGTSALNQLAGMYGLQQAPAAPAGPTGAAYSAAAPMSMQEFSTTDLYTPQTATANRNPKFAWRGDTLSGPTLEDQYEQYTAGFQGQPSGTQALTNATTPTTGATPATGKADFSQFYESPDYQFAFDQGMRGTEQSLARRGLTGSGAEMKALSRFNQGLASQQFNNYKNSLASLAGIGQTSTTQGANMGTQVASNVGAGQRAAGDARASSYLNTGAAISGAADNYGQMRLLQAGGYI